MKILLHIGDAKCGSSSIQASLFQARAELLAQGVLYHPASPTNGHFSFVTLVNGQTRGNDADQEALARRNIAETRELVALHRPEYLLITGESLFSVAPDLLMGLLTEITGTPAPAHVVAFLRHPVEFYLSGVQQALKASHEFTPPHEFLRDTPGTFRRWKAFDGCASITTRLFDRRRLTGGSVVAEFDAILRAITGLNLPTLPEANANTSLSAEQMIVLQHFRRDFLADRKGQFVAQSTRIVHFFEELNQKSALLGARPRLTGAVRSCIATRNARFTAELDTMFPDLGMAASQTIPQVDWVTQSRGWTEDVASILEDHDPALLDQLTSLLPDYLPAIETPEGMASLPARLAALGKGSASHRPYLRYLARCGHKDLADQLRELLAQTAASPAAKGAAKPAPKLVPKPARKPAAIAVPLDAPKPAPKPAGPAGVKPAAKRPAAPPAAPKPAALKAAAPQPAKKIAGCFVRLPDSLTGLVPVAPQTPGSGLVVERMQGKAVRPSGGAVLAEPADGLQVAGWLRIGGAKIAPGLPVYACLRALDPAKGAPLRYVAMVLGRGNRPEPGAEAAIGPKGQSGDDWFGFRLRPSRRPNLLPNLRNVPAGRYAFEILVGDDKEVSKAYALSSGVEVVVGDRRG